MDQQPPQSLPVSMHHRTRGDQVRYLAGEVMKYADSNDLMELAGIAMALHTTAADIDRAGCEHPIPHLLHEARQQLRTLDTLLHQTHTRIDRMVRTALQERQAANEPALHQALGRVRHVERRLGGAIAEARRQKDRADALQARLEGLEK